MNIPTKKLLFLTTIWAFFTFAFPGFIRQGVVYCDDQIAVKNSLSCSKTEIQSGNIEYYARYLAVGILFVLIGMIVARQKNMKKKNKSIAYIILCVGLIITLAYSWLVPPLVMFPQGESFTYAPHVPTRSYAAGIFLVSIIGLILGTLLVKLMTNEQKVSGEYGK